MIEAESSPYGESPASLFITTSVEKVDNYAQGEAGEQLTSPVQR